MCGDKAQAPGIPRKLGFLVAAASWYAPVRPPATGPGAGRPDNQSRSCFHRPDQGTTTNLARLVAPDRNRPKGFPTGVASLMVRHVPRSREVIS
jgi:hypothetical protein